MATEVIMPKVDMVMEAGTFVEWLKKEGDMVQKGEALFVMMTDKAAIEVEAPESGVLAGLRAKPDEVIPVTQVIGYILQPGEDLPISEKTLQLVDTDDRSQATPSQVVDTSQVLAKEQKAVIQGAEHLVRATPLARSLARELKLDLNRISGSGPRGRIYRADVERFLQSASAVVARGSTVPVGDTASLLPELHISLPAARQKGRVVLKGPRAIIARRMAYSALTIPHVHITFLIDMTEAIRLRERVNPVFEKRVGGHVSYTAIIARAVAYLLTRHPYLNSSLVGEEIILWEDVHLGIATDLEEYLVVPVIREAQHKNLEQMAEEINRLVAQARSKKLQPSEMSGSTFTITNLGMKGAVSFNPIINPPETAILAAGKIVDTPVALGAEVAVRPMMNVTLAVDHRVVDGAQATQFLRDLKEVLENPYLLV